MSQPTNSKYLDTKVLTSSQPRLHLMLLEGALRLLSQVERTLQSSENFVEIDGLLSKSTEILGELVRSVSGGKTEYSTQLEEQYAFIYRELVTCRVEFSAEKFSSCVKLLEYQRETWRLACAQCEGNGEPNRSQPVVPHLHTRHYASSEGFSCEA